MLLGICKEASTLEGDEMEPEKTAKTTEDEKEKRPQDVQSEDQAENGARGVSKSGTKPIPPRKPEKTKGKDD